MPRYGDDESKIPYFESGLTILAADGFPGLKVTAVCAALNVTTGGFYYYFRNLRHYAGELLEYWLEARTANMVEAAEAEADPVRRLDILVAEGARLPHGAERAIRQWASSNAAASAAVTEADNARMAVLQRTLAEIGLPDELGAKLAEIALYLLIGYEFRGPDRGDPTTFAWGLELLVDYIERQAGLPTRSH